MHPSSYAPPAGAATPSSSTTIFKKKSRLKKINSAPGRTQSCMMKSSKLLLHLSCLLAASWIHGAGVAAISNPPIQTVGAFRPVQSNSICGMNGLEDYCIYTTDEAASLSPNCMRDQCDNTCPFSSTPPSPLDLVSLAGSFSGGVTATQGMPGREGSAVSFQGGSISVVTAEVPLISSTNGFSFTAWINQDNGNRG